MYSIQGGCHASDMVSTARQGPLIDSIRFIDGPRIASHALHLVCHLIDTTTYAGALHPTDSIGDRMVHQMIDRATA